MDQTRNSKIDNLSLICAILVVMIHVTHGHPAEASLAVKIWLNVFHDGICRIAVPFFFLIAGYFLAAHFDEERWYSKAIKRRCVSLLVPYVILDAAFASLVFCLHPERIPKYLSGWLSMAGLSHHEPILGPLWFVRGLFLLVLISPIIVWMMRSQNRARAGLLVMFCLYAMIAPFEQGASGLQLLFWTGFPLVGLFYFSIGCYFRKWPVDCPMRFCSRPWWILVVMFVILLANKARGLMAGEFLYNYYYLAIIPIGMLVLWGLVPDVRWPSRLTSCSFPIYLLHLFVIVVARRILGESEMIWNYSLGWQIGIAVIVVVCSIGLTWLIRFVSPWNGKILFGGR